jgi:general stress protein YciG
MAKKKDTGMTTREAGRKGGKMTAQRYGTEFYEEIGRKGGQTVSDKYGPEFYGEIGRKGGQRVKELIEAGRQASGYDSSD